MTRAEKWAHERAKRRREARPAYAEGYYEALVSDENEPAIALLRAAPPTYTRHTKHDGFIAGLHLLCPACSKREVVKRSSHPMPNTFSFSELLNSITVAGHRSARGVLCPASYFQVVAYLDFLKRHA